MDKLHETLKDAMKNLPSDFSPYGERDRETDWGPDCSCGCKHFIPLQGEVGFDWGVCANRQSPRFGLLTFEHQGCRQFEGDPNLEAVDTIDEQVPVIENPYREDI